MNSVIGSLKTTGLVHIIVDLDVEFLVFKLPISVSFLLDDLH